MAGMMKFFRPNNSFGPGNRPSSPTGNGAESSGTAGRQKRNRPIPPPLQLVDQAVSICLYIVKLLVGGLLIVKNNNYGCLMEYVVIIEGN